MTCVTLGTLSKCASDLLYAIDHSKIIIFLSRMKISFLNFFFPSSTDIQYVIFVYCRRYSIVYFQNL
jgi:hypothetical protein